MRLEMPGGAAVANVDIALEPSQRIVQRRVETPVVPSGNRVALATAQHSLSRASSGMTVESPPLQWRGHNDNVWMWLFCAAIVSLLLLVWLRRRGNC
jgi:hypothetical protein